MKLGWVRTGALLPAVLLMAGCGRGGEATVEGVVGEKKERVATVRTLGVVAEEVVDLAVLSADLHPGRRATLAAEVTGTVEQLTVDVGDRVRAGATLARIDTRTLRQQVAEAEALFRQAQDRYERAEKLIAKRSITKEQHLDAVAGRDVAEARLASARLMLEKSQVRAPWSGNIAARHVEVGDYAVPGQSLFELVAVDRLKVRASASAADVPYLEIGRPVTVRVDVLPGEVFAGEIVRLGAELDPDTRTLDVEAELDNSSGRLRPGYFGRLEVARRVIPNAVVVPLAAVVDLEQQKALYVVEDGRAVRREIQLGPIIGERIVVASGLAAGERVVIAGQQQVGDGQRVVEEGAV